MTAQSQPQPNVAEQLSDGLISALAAMLLAYAEQAEEPPKRRVTRKAAKKQVPS